MTLDFKSLNEKREKQIKSKQSCFYDKKRYTHTNLQPLWGPLNISKGANFSLEDKKLLEKERFYTIFI